MLTILGIIGSGFVWGWLSALYIGRSINLWQTILPFLAATALLCIAIFFALDWPFILYFLGAAFLAFSIHLAWLQDLRRRYD